MSEDYLMNQKHILAIALLGTGAFLVYKEMQKRPVNVPSDIYSDGMISGISSDTIIDSVLPWIRINPVVKPLVSGLAKQLLSGLMDENTINAQWERVD